MKVQLTFKTPDVVDYAVEDLDADDEFQARHVCDKYIRFSEYVDIEIDTETGEAKVLPVSS